MRFGGNLPGALVAAAEETRELIPVRAGVWRTRNGPYFGLLIETDAGMIVFYPIDRDFANWLNAEIAKRFNKPIYSHNHWDHVSEGQAFDGHDPLNISHELARNSIARMRIDTRVPSRTFLEGPGHRAGRPPRRVALPRCQ